MPVVDARPAGLRGRAARRSGRSHATAPRPPRTRRRSPPTPSPARPASARAVSSACRAPSGRRQHRDLADVGREVPHGGWPGALDACVISSISPGTSGSPSALYDGRLRVARLPLEGQVADHRDRARRLIRALGAPGRDRGVVERAVEREVEPDVVLRARAARVRPAGERARRARSSRRATRAGVAARSGRRSRGSPRPPPACTAALDGSPMGGGAGIDRKASSPTPGARSRERGPTGRRRSVCIVRGDRRRAPAPRSGRARAAARSVASWTVEPGWLTTSGAFCGTYVGVDVVERLERAVVPAVRRSRPRRCGCRARPASRRPCS